MKTREFVFMDIENTGFQSCHASTIEKIGDDAYICAFFGGTTEGTADQAIYFAKRIGGKWGNLTKLSEEDDMPYWNPVLLFQERSNTLYIFYKKGHKIQNWKTVYKVSTNGGATWTREEELLPHDPGRGPVRTKIIPLTNGGYIAGCSTEGDVWCAFADKADDTLLQWEKGNVLSVDIDTKPTQNHNKIAVSAQSFHGRGIIQPTLWEDAENNIHMMIRSTEGRIFRSDSIDDGKTWAKPYPTVLPNNNSGIDAVYRDGKLHLVYNPVGETWGKRTPLTVALSLDNGASWEKVIDLETGEGEFSYPAIISRDGDLIVTYTHNRKNIAFCII